MANKGFILGCMGVFLVGAMIVGPKATKDMASGVGAVLYIVLACFFGIFYLVAFK